jgi:hypothetical protein
MLFHRRKHVPIERILHPGPEEVRKLSDGDLSKFIAGWREGSAERLIGEAEQRRRERWSGPVILSLAMSCAALLLSLIALISRNN